MGRKKAAEGGTRELIVDAALALFMEHGYEETSVRMILDRAGAVVGSFYHYFDSKEALFEASISLFLKKYEARIAEIASDASLTFPKQLQLLLDAAEESARRYFGRLDAGQLHWTIQYALHKRTLQSILPSVQHMIQRALAEGTAQNVLHLDPATLATVVLQSMEAILHAKPMDAADAAQLRLCREQAEAYVRLILRITEERPQE